MSKQNAEKLLEKLAIMHDGDFICAEICDICRDVSCHHKVAHKYNVMEGCDGKLRCTTMNRCPKCIPYYKEEGNDK